MSQKTFKFWPLIAKINVAKINVAKINVAKINVALINGFRVYHYHHHNHYLFHYRSSSIISIIYISIYFYLSPLVSHVKMFADDTMIFVVVRDPHSSSETLNQDLACVGNWARQWKMSFNPDPDKQAVEVLFSRQNNTVQHPPLYFNNAQVPKEEKHKHSGLLNTKLETKD